MDGKLTGTRTSKDQSIEQALRRLKYLHTSLMPNEAATKHNGPKIDEKILSTKALQLGNDKQSNKARRTPEKQYFLSLQPKTSKTPAEKAKTSKTRVRVKRKQEKKALRTGRAPLLAYRVESSSVAKDETWESKNDNGIILNDHTSSQERASKSASGTFRTSDPKCIQCFTNDFDERVHRTKANKEYFTNMRINRVTFSARPSGYKVKPVRERKIEVPKSCLFNGWRGMRSKKEASSKGNANNDLKRQASKEAMDVTVGLKTLKLEPKKMQQEYTEQIIPQPPPTPVKQIDIKLPQGVMVRYKLTEDD